MLDRYAAGRLLLKRQRDRFCAVARSVSPDAPTLCEGWTAYDVAAHLDALCRDPLSLPGIALTAFEPVARRRAARLRGRLGYAGLIQRIAGSSAQIPVFGADPLTGWGHHLGEWFVHTEDLRRPNGLPTAPFDPELDEALWRRLAPAAKALRSLIDGPVVLKHLDGRTIALGRGERPRIITGQPGELMVQVYRGRAARVRISQG